MNNRQDGQTEVYAIPENGLTVKDLPVVEQPREIMKRRGAQNVDDDILIAILLRTGTKKRNVVELARYLRRTYGSLTAMSQASVEELARVAGMGPVKSQVLVASLELAKRLASEQVPERTEIRKPEHAATVLREIARPLEKEVFWMLPLDKKNRLLRPPIEITKGIADASLVHPREVFKEAILVSAVALVVAHNHPSGDPTPSKEDVRITESLVHSGSILKIPVLDHIIMGHSGAGNDGEDYCSLREEGLANFE